MGYIKGHAHRGARNPKWKGGVINTSNGYLMVLAPEHPNAMKNGYVLQHRFVASNDLGRALKPKEIVHHEDGNKANNDVANLAILDDKSHRALHFFKESNPRWKGGLTPKKCLACGKDFIASYRNHKRAKFCSNRCKTSAGPHHPRRKSNIQ